jgi:putative nucleotidyltransferase with HDIG domain
MATQENPYVTMDQLKIGLHVHLDLKWFEHPFAFNNFMIKSEDQIKLIRGLGLARVRYDPARSDGKPPPVGSTEAVGDAAENTAPGLPSEHPALAAKRALIEKIREQRETVARIETAFVDTAKTIHGVERNLLTNPAESVAQARTLVARIAESILAAPDLALHVMEDKIGDEDLYFHSLNVTTLALMVARDLKLPQELVQLLGMGALFHDVGCRDVPAELLSKSDALLPSEREEYERHCEHGVAIGTTLLFAPVTLAIIREHHERFDGSGYPKGLKGESINLLARIVAIANHYDELCNPKNRAAALTPHEALSTMFAKQRAQFDPKLLQVFVRCLGVYPPGTIVELSNGVIGMVATINTARPMKPSLVVYDAETPKDEAILVDLQNESDVNIVRAIRPAQLPPEMYAYLSPRKQVSYYFDVGASSREPARK